MLLSTYFHVIFLACLVPMEVSAHQDVVAINRRGDTNTATSAFFEATASASLSSQIIDTNNNYNTLRCNDTNSLFNVELKTDSYPDDTSWRLIDVGTNQIIHSVERGDYQENYTIYNESWCIPSEQCYEFTLYDSYGDGLFSPAYCKIFYENQNNVVLENQSFLNATSSILFGDGCSPSPSPTYIPSRSPPPSSDNSGKVIIPSVVTILFVIGAIVLCSF